MEEKQVIGCQQADSSTTPLDFFKVSLRGMFKNAVIGGAVFFLVAVVIHHIVIKTQHTYAFIRAIETAVVLIFYILAGAFMGMTWGLTSTLDTTAEGLRKKVRDVIGPLITEIIESLPLGDRAISVDVFVRVVNSTLSRFSHKHKSRFRILPPALMLSRFFIKTIVGYLQETLVTEFVQTLKEKGQNHLTVANIEEFIRNKLVDIVVEGFRCRLNTMRYVISTMSLALLFGPFVLILLL